MINSGSMAWHDGFDEGYARAVNKADKLQAQVDALMEWAKFANRCMSNSDELTDWTGLGVAYVALPDELKEALE